MKNPSSRQARIIAKIPLTPEQRAQLGTWGVTWIADSNPASRDDEKEILARVGDAEGILISISTPISRSIIAQSPGLKFIQTWSTGVDNIDLEAAREAGITVCNVPDFSTDAVAESTLALLLLLAHPLREAHQNALQGQWEYMKFRGINLKGKSLLLVGRGRIAQRVGALAQAFGMKVTHLHTQSTPSDWAQALREADFISLHCPLTPATRHLIDEKVLQQVKRGVRIVNNSRGGVVDEAALLASLESGQVASACMDVFETEPPQAANPLLRHPKVFVTPHCTWNTEESLAQLTESSLQNLRIFLQDPSLKSLQNRVI